MLLRRQLLCAAMALALALPAVSTILAPSPAQASTAFGRPHFEFVEGEHPVWTRVLTQIDDDLRRLRACRNVGSCSDEAVAAWADMVNSLGRDHRPAPMSVNRAINALIDQRSDTSVHGAADIWAGPLDTMRKGAGDCEDIAILKLATLIALEVPLDEIQLLILKVVGGAYRGAVHAVLLTGSPDEPRMVLDSLTDRLLSDDRIQDYMPLYSVAVPSSFYRH